MRRLFSTFAGGPPGAGLAVLRLAAGIVLSSSAAAVSAGAAGAALALPILEVVLAVLLLAGLWTPAAGLILAALELARLLLTGGGTHLLLAAVGIALSLLGPGIWSIDARLFGWRRLDVPHRAAPIPASKR